MTDDNEYYCPIMGAFLNNTRQPQTDALNIAREALTKARNTIAGCGMPKIAADICDEALEALKETT